MGSDGRTEWDLMVGQCGICDGRTVWDLMVGQCGI